MSVQSTRAPIDLAPKRPARPTLALVLALLAVPGSTLAWELPEARLYIGLPLAIAAIVLGTRARRRDEGKRRATTATVLGTLCILQTAIWTVVSLMS